MKLRDFLVEKFDSVENYVTDAEMLRQAIVEELDAINIYKAMAEKATNSNVKRVLEHVIEEEKHHIGEFQSLLEKLDPDHTEGLEGGEKEVRDLGINV
ncbi:MAG: demethoxyubiquinone hydroxylase family protein [archaeon]